MNNTVGMTPRWKINWAGDPDAIPEGWPPDPLSSKATRGKIDEYVGGDMPVCRGGYWIRPHDSSKQIIDTDGT